VSKALDLELEGKVAVVTGGGTGIGRVIAHVLASLGANVAICARRIDVLEATAADLTRATGGTVLPVYADTTNFTSLKALAKTIVNQFGGIGILVNCAASPSGLDSDAIEHADVDALSKDIDTKTLGYLRCAKALVPHMKKSQWGRIVNIGGLTARTSDSLSGMRNVAISHLTKTLSDQLGSFGITVNQVHPGLVRTPHVEELFAKQAKERGTSIANVEAAWYGDTPIGRMLEPLEIANFVAYLCSPLAGAITGQSIAVDGGLTRGVYV
jgi:NAD(P)-dependent dehydrogenase (short-subunit alcohol dehydrogenase family)